MKFFISNFPSPMFRHPRKSVSSRCLPIVNRQSSIVHERAFTMIEIAICLAIVGFALVAIIGVLPIGMNTQRDNREETIVNQDALLLINAVRTGARGVDDLTNYVYAITNYASSVVVGYDNSYLTSGARIVGLMSTPEFTATASGIPTNWFVAGVVSNHVVAYVRSLNGLAAEKWSGSLVSFNYQVVCQNTPVPMFNSGTGFGLQLVNCQSELRLKFFWPLLPNGNVGGGRQSYRATIAGQLVSTNSGGVMLYFYQSQSFTNAP